MSTSGDQIVDEPGSHRSVHVFVVDEDGEPVTGQDVSARFSFAWGPDMVHHQYTDVKGHAEFLGAHSAEPLHMTFFVRGKSFGPYTGEDRATYTVEISRE